MPDVLTPSYHKSIHKQTQMILLLKKKELAEDRLPEEIKERDQIEGREQIKTTNLDVNKL